MSDSSLITETSAAFGDAFVVAPEPVAPAAASVDGRAVDFGPLEAVPASAPAAGHLAAELERLHDVPVELTVEIGRTRMTIGETLALGPGSIVSLERLAGEPVDLLVNGKRIAYGEVVVIDEEFGLRITELVDSQPTPASPPATPAPGFTASA